MTDIGQTISHFRIVSKLGAGGMGEVYLAEDSLLRRMVALKKVSESLHESEGIRRRLLHEARTVAQLNHPNIAAIYDVLESGGHMHIVMEYVEGESLRAKLHRGPIPMREALRIGSQVADALQYAHVRGIIHRDLKPANLMLTAQNTVKVLDFGLAKKSILPASVVSEELSTESRFTVPGTVAGTLAYMSPDQVMGRPPQANHDIYSLGVVLYEMVTGKRPFEAMDPMSLAMAILKERPPSPSDINPSVPAEVSAVIRKAMAPESEQRYPSAASLGEDLAQVLGENVGNLRLFGFVGSSVRGMLSGKIRRWAFGIAALVLIVAAIFLAFWIRSGQKESNSLGLARPIIAVLPFLNLSGNSADDALCDSFAYILNSSLASTPEVTMVPHSSVLHHRNKERDLNKIGRELGVTLLIDAGIQRTESAIVIPVTLVLIATNRVIWGTSFSSKDQDTLALQQQIAEGLIGALQMKLSLSERERILSLPTKNRDAFANYSQAMKYIQRQDVSGNLDRAIKLLQWAVGLDPQFALAHAAIGRAFLLKYTNTPNPAFVDAAREATLEALRLDPERPEVRCVLASILGQTGKAEEALKELEKVIALQPRSDEARRLRGEVLLGQGKGAQAIKDFEAAIALRPDYWGNHGNLGFAYLRLGRSKEAIPHFQRITELQPDNASGFQMLGTAYQVLNETSKALANYQQALRIQPSARSHSNIGTIYYEQKNFVEAARSYEKAIQLDKSNSISWRNLADAYHRLGEMDKARSSYSEALSLSKERLKVNPKDARALAFAALCEAKLGQRAEAERDIREAVALNPEDNEVLFKKAVLHSLAGQKQEALAALRQALKKGYSVRLAREDYDLAAIRGMPEFEQILSTKRLSSN